MRKLVRFTESDLKRITNKVIKEGMFGIEYLKLEEEKYNLQKTLKTILAILDEMEYFSKKNMSPDQYNELKFNLKRKLNTLNQDMDSVVSKIRKYEDYLMSTNK